MFADDLGCLVALEPSRTGIPAGDDAVLVQHVDGVVRHGLDKKAIATVVAQRRSETIGLFHEDPNTQQFGTGGNIVRSAPSMASFRVQTFTLQWYNRARTRGWRF